jgi:hypothetical protein
MVNYLNYVEQHLAGRPNDIEYVRNHVLKVSGLLQGFTHEFKAKRIGLIPPSPGTSVRVMFEVMPYDNVRASSNRSQDFASRLELLEKNPPFVNNAVIAYLCITNAIMGDTDVERLDTMMSGLDMVPLGDHTIKSDSLQ